VRHRPVGAENTLHLRYVIDTNLIDDQSDAMEGLWRYHDDRMIQLSRTDVMDTELSEDLDPARRARLLALSEVLPEQSGILVWGHSRFDHAVWCSDTDAAEWDRIWTVMHPGRDRGTASDNDIRDAMHVMTARRYGADAFVTLDGSGKRKGILGRAEAVRRELGFEIWTPTQALDWANAAKARSAERARCNAAIQQRWAAEMNLPG